METAEKVTFMNRHNIAANEKWILIEICSA